MIFAVGSTRRPKVDALRRVLPQLGVAYAGAEILPVDMKDVAPEMPLTLQAMLDGARARAERAFEATATPAVAPAFGIGLEGGIEVRGEAGARRGYLMSWAYVTDGARGAHGCGGAIELPQRLLEEVADRGTELAVAIDAFTGEMGVRGRQGAWGVLTAGRIDRAQSFEIALLNAFAPFLNREAYA